MQQAYFIRHGNADYFNSCLTQLGVNQAQRLSSTLELLLPKTIQSILVSSPSNRAIETAQLLIPLLERKTGKRIYIKEEELLSELRSMGSEESILARGKENIQLVEKYQSTEYGFFVAHEKIIAATCMAIVESYGLPTPNFLSLIEDQLDERTIVFFMRRMNCSREEALKKIKSYDKNPLVELPHIAEASAVHLDFQQKQVRYILPS